MPGEFHNFLDNSSDQLSVLHLNISSIKKYFENFKLVLDSIISFLSVICLSETWWDDLATIEKSLLSNPIIIAHIKEEVIVKMVESL